MPINEANAGVDAINIPTLLKSKLLIAIRKKTFATTSQAPDRRAYLAKLFELLILVFGAKIKVKQKTPIRAPNSAPSIFEFSISVIKKEKPEKKVAAVAARKKLRQVIF